MEEDNKPVATIFEISDRLISAFEDKIASFQYARAAIKQLDKDYGMNSSDHIKVLTEFIDAAIAESKEARKKLREAFLTSAGLNNPTTENK